MREGRIGNSRQEPGIRDCSRNLETGSDAEVIEAGTRKQETGAGAEVMEEYHFLTCFHGLLILLSYETQYH